VYGIFVSLLLEHQVSLYFYFVKLFPFWNTLYLKHLQCIILTSIFQRLCTIWIYGFCRLNWVEFNLKCTVELLSNSTLHHRMRALSRNNLNGINESMYAQDYFQKGDTENIIFLRSNYRIPCTKKACLKEIMLCVKITRKPCPFYLWK